MGRIEEINQEVNDRIKAEGMDKEWVLCYYDAFTTGAQWADRTMIKKLRELKSNYEKDLDAWGGVYEINIQICAKISLIEKLIYELGEE